MDSSCPQSTTPNILVIDDDFELLEMLQLVLESEGFQVYCARDGAEGLLAFDRFPTLQIILLDLMMPVMNGFQFLEHLAERDDRGIPVVVLTAAESSIFGHPALKRANRIAQKPFNVDELLSILRETMRRDAREMGVGR